MHKRAAAGIDNSRSRRRSRQIQVAADSHRISREIPCGASQLRGIKITQTATIAGERTGKGIAPTGEGVDAIENIAAVKGLIGIARRWSNRQRRSGGIMTSGILNREAHDGAAGNYGGN